MDDGNERPRGPPELRRRLLWLTLFRLVANTLSLAAVGARLVSESPRELSSADLGAFATIAAVYVVTLGYSFRLRFGRVGTNDAIFQSTGDLLIAAALVFLTGGAESPFTFAFSLAVIGAALLMGFRAAMVAAVASLGLYAPGGARDPGTAGRSSPRQCRPLADWSSCWSATGWPSC